MEGILPLVFKTIKKNRTRRQYEYLSSGVASATHNQRTTTKNARREYNISDFYPNEDLVIRNSPEKIKGNNLQRNQSFQQGSLDSAKKNHRRMFSCSCMPGY